jgi:iron complex outermembrane recepter protein
MRCAPNLGFCCRAMTWAASVIVLCIASATAPVLAANLDEPVDFNIPAQNLDASLVLFSEQAKVQVTSAAAQLKGLTADAVVGKYRIADALSKLLQHSGLSFKPIGTGTVSIGKFSADSAGAPRTQAVIPVGYMVASTSADPISPAAPSYARAGDTVGPSTSTGGAQLEEVIVTARKRTENLQDVPMSVTAFTKADIENFGFRNVQDIAFSVPNFTWGRLTTISEIICIRGICSDSSAPGFDTGIAVILDDVYIGRASGFATNLLDIDQIEVLRGPQGTLQGRNATGGTINISTTPPSNVLSGQAELSYGNYDQIVAQGVLSGPLINNILDWKIAYSYRNHEGFEENIDVNKPLDTEDSYAVRGQLRFMPTTDFKTLLTADFDHFNNHDFHNAYGPPDVTEPPPEFFTRLVGGNFQNYGSRQVYGGAANVYWTLPNNLSLISVSSYRSFRVTDVQDASGILNFGPSGAGTILGTAREDQEQSQFTQEVRITSPVQHGFSWLAGVYYYWEQLHDYENFLFGLNTGTVVNGSAAIDDATMHTNSLAGFGSATWDLDSFWSITAGLRDTRNSRHITMVETLGIDGTAVAPDGSSFTYVNLPTLQNPVPETFQAPIIYPTDHNALTDKAWTGDFTVTQHWRDNVSTYERYARGFKGGGFNANFNNGFGAGVVKPEFIDSYEIGERSELLDRRLRVNATLFYLRQRDQQVLIYDSVLNVYVTSNAPKTTSYGGELDISSALTRDLTVELGVGVTDAHFKAGQWAGNLVPYTSPVNVTGTVQYSHPLTAAIEFFFFTDVSYRDGYYTSPDDQPVSHQKSYVWIDGKIGIQAPGGKWSVGLYDRNALNTNVLAFGTNVPGLYTVGFIQEPRTWGLDAHIKF